MEENALGINPTRVGILTEQFVNLTRQHYVTQKRGRLKGNPISVMVERYRNWNLDWRIALRSDDQRK